MAEDMILSKGHQSVYFSGDSYNQQLAFLNDTFVYVPEEPTPSNTPIVAKLDSLGKPLWAVSPPAGISGFDRNRSTIYIAKSPDEGVFTSWSENLYNGCSMEEHGRSLCFSMARYSPTGEQQWLIQLPVRIEDPQKCKTLQLSANAHGHMVMGGYFYGRKIQIGPLELESVRSPAVFTLEFDADGQLLGGRTVDLAVQSSPPLTSAFFDLVLTEEGITYLCFGSDETVEIEPLCAVEPRFVQIAALRVTEGRILWERQFKGDGISRPTALAYGNNSLIHVAGQFSHTLDFDGLRPSNNCEMGNASFIVVLDRNGRVLSAVAPFTNDALILDIQANDAGHYFIMADFYDAIPLSSASLWISDQQYFIGKYNLSHQLLSERWLYTRKDPQPFRRTQPVLLKRNDDKLVMMHHTHHVSIDPIGLWSTHKYQAGTFIMQFSLPPEHIQASTPDEQLAVSDVLIGPNPVHNYLYLYARDGDFSPASLALFDATGRRVAISLLPLTGPSNQLDVSALPPGMYFLSLQWKGELLSWKFIKQ